MRDRRPVVVSTVLVSILTVLIGGESSVFAAKDVSVESCARALHTPRSKLADAFTFKVRVKDFNYRVTLALRMPSAQASPLVVQLFWENRRRSPEIEAYIKQQIGKVFTLAPGGVQTSIFQSLVTEPVGRADFEDGVRQMTTEMQSRFSSVAVVYPSLSPFMRSRSPAVSEAARMMTAFLRRSKVVSAVDEADRILNRAHTRLILSLTESELRFFTYDLFDEVLSYEKDGQMQQIARTVDGQVAPKDLDYGAIHAAIRTKFVVIAREFIDRLRAGDRTHIEGVNSALAEVIRAGEAVFEEKPKELPFSQEKFAELKELVGEKTFVVGEIDAYRMALRSLAFSTSEEALEIKHFPRMRLLTREILSTLNFLASEIQQQRNNEPNNEDVDETGRHMSVSVIVVHPGNGEAGSSFIGMDGPNAPSSFEHQPRRLNSGRGNQKERFDYDSPRERD